MDNINVVEVFMNGSKVGRIALTPDSLCAFEYDAQYLASDAEKILSNDDYTGEGLNTLYKYAGSSGGARPKVFVKIDGVEWLVKFRASVDRQQLEPIVRTKEALTINNTLDKVTITLDKHYKAIFEKMAM